MQAALRFHARQQIQELPPGINTPLDVVQRFGEMFPNKIGPSTLRRIAEEAAKVPCPKLSPTHTTRSRDDLRLVAWLLRDLGQVTNRRLAEVFGKSESWVELAVKVGRVIAKERGI